MAADRKPEFFATKDIRSGNHWLRLRGIAAGVAFCDTGHQVIGFDLDPMQSGKAERRQILHRAHHGRQDRRARQGRAIGRHLRFHSLRDVDAVLICVPTPLDERREPDLSYVENTAIAIGPHLQRSQLIVLESTTYPGTTEELVLPILEASGLKCPITRGEKAENVKTDFYLAFSPEREDPGNKQYGLAQIPKVVGGANPPSGRAAANLYQQIVASSAGQFHARR